MRLTERRLNRATLARQLLLRREPLSAADAVRRVVALQAQEAPSPYIALWNRVAGFDPADLDAAFARFRVVKATLMRITLHAVHADDYPAFHDAMVGNLRASRLNDPRFRTSGLTTADVDALAPELLEFAARPRTRVEIEGRFEPRLGERARAAWWALRTFAPVVHAPTGGPWSFGTRAAFLATRREDPSEDREGSVRQLVRRYLEAFGPASVADVAQFALLGRTVVRDAVRALGDELVPFEGPDGSRLFDVPGAPLPPEDVLAPPRLLPMWDSVLLAYFDRSRLIPPEYRRVVGRVNGDLLPTLLVDGSVAGVWRPLDGAIEATAFHRLSKDAWKGLEAEASGLLGLLAERDPSVYGRYGHWWKRLSGEDVRILSG